MADNLACPGVSGDEDEVRERREIQKGMEQLLQLVRISGIGSNSSHSSEVKSGQVSDTPAGKVFRSFPPSPSFLSVSRTATSPPLRVF